MWKTTVAIDAQHSGFNEVAITDDPAPHISNLTLVLSPDYGKRKNLPAHVIKAKKARVQNYIRRYLPAAKTEMRESNIPVSITLAQGLLGEQRRRQQNWPGYPTTTSGSNAARSASAALAATTATIPATICSGSLTHRPNPSKNTVAS